ncbi:unnamed protein product [Rotaria socialis]|uniref:Uncharacterized protein n=2 Tax=Rotaria socialis TaxID=392032 RepID=A0A818A5P2_9BILA|nr:unnamed protein product [Rotaria socialis]
MGCSNARLLVQAPSATETGARTNNPVLLSTDGTSPANVPIDTTTRMHLTGVDLVVERNGSYTLLLTPKTHKQLMPYVLRKKRFRILVDKPRSEPTLNSNESIMEDNKELKLNSEKDKKSKQSQMNQSIVASMEQVASDELNKAETRLIGGRSIDRGNLDDEDENIQSDDEGMIEEIVTTVEQDKDLECKVKKKVETKKTTSQHPDTHNTITKVVKTEVTEITRTITINDHHDLERAKRELGIDDVNKLLPSSKWAHQSNVTEIKQKQHETVKEIATSKDVSLNNQTKQTQPDKKFILSESTMVGRGPVTETISSLSSPKSEQKPKETKKKKKKSKFCSCTRSVADAEQDKQDMSTIPTEEKPKISYETTPVFKSTIDTQIQGQQLISSDIKQLIIDKKFLLIEYIHSKIFSPSKFFTSDEQDLKGRKISSRILDLLRYDRCSSWAQMFEQFNEEYTNYLPTDSIIHPMVNTYESLFTTKQAHLLNTFSTIHHENDIGNIQENSDYVTIVEKYKHERDDQTNAAIIVQQSVDNIINTVEQLHETNQEEQVVEEKYKHERDDQTNAAIIVQQSVDNIINTVEQLHETNQEEQVVEAINDDEQVEKEVDMTDDIQPSLPIYNEEQLVKMLADLSPHKPITLAEAIAYQYIDVEDPKLGLSNDIIQHIKHLFRPLSDQSVSNLIRVQRSGEYLTDINLAETNPFEKLNLTEPHVYQLQQLFEPTLDFNEKQFRSLTEAILSNKEQYDQLQFDIARTSLPIYDAKDSSINDFSQSDSGYSMTTATHESLASKIKIEFEPINQDIPVPLARSDLHEDEKIDLDKATQEQLNKYELNHDLIQIIKSDYNVSNKTIGQAILSRELRLESADPSDVSRLNSLGIHKEQARVLHAFFFPKQTRIIAYSPEPGLFVEAQTTYNPDYPGYKTDTTIIQIQDKQLSSDLLAKQRNIHDERTSPILFEQKQESEIIIPLGPSETTPATVPKENLSSTPSSATTTTTTTTTTITKAPIKKRKSSGHGSFLTCFRSKKSKAGTEQQGQAIIQPTVVVCQISSPEKIMKPTHEKCSIDYAVTPDGKRIYIDTFRDRPGLDMSYKPNDFENRFVLPISKPISEYEQPSTPEPEPEPITLKSQVIEHEPIIHLEPRSPVIEPVDVQPEERNIIIPLTKTDEMTIQKKRAHIDLRGAAIKLPDIELVQPGPLPTLSIGKENKAKKPKTKSTGSLCASCFGKKSKENKRQKETISETAQAPIEHKKIIEPEKKEDLSSTTIVAAQTNESSALPSIVTNEAILPRVNIDVFRDRNFEKGSENIPQAENRSEAAREKLLSKVEINNQSSSSAPLSSISTTTVESPSQFSAIKDISIFSNVNIDTFRDRTFQKGSESLPQPTKHIETTNLNTAPQPQESHYEIPANVPVQLPTTTIKTIGSSVKDASIFAHVNIDTFKERTLEKGSEIVHKPIEHVDVTVTPSHEECRVELPTNESVQLLATTMKTIEPSVKDASIFSQVNIDTFRERTFEKGSEIVHKPIEHVDVTVASSHQECRAELPTNGSVQLLAATMKTIEPSVKDASIFSQVNIDTFRERTFEKGSENVPKPIERTDLGDAKVTASLKESHYETPTNEPVLSPVASVKTIAAAVQDSSIFSQINIDTFRDRTFEKGSESLPKPTAPTTVTDVKLSSSTVESHYEFPKNEPLPTRATNEPVTTEASIFSKVNIDTFRERTFEKSPKNSFKPTVSSDMAIRATSSIEEPHYQLPSSEPVPLSSTPLEHEYSTVDRNTYDVPRTIEFQQTASSIEGKSDVETIKNAPMISSTIDMQKSSGDFLSTKIVKEKVETDEISPIIIDVLPGMDSKETKIQDASKTVKKGKKSKTDKKSGLFSSFCHQSKKKSKIPALHLPPIESNLTANTQINSLHHSDDDPLHIPSTSLPKLDIPLPVYNRPEVDMTTGQIKQTSEFNIPAINLTTIPNLQLPEHNIQLIGSNSDQIKVPNIELPNLQFASQEQIKEKIVIVSTVEDPSSITTEQIKEKIVIVSTVEDPSSITTVSIAQTEKVTPTLSSIEQTTAITGKNLDQSFGVPVVIENKTYADLNSSLSSSEPTSTLSKSATIPVTIGHDFSTQKTSENILIETKSKPTKRSSTLSLCSCFSNKANIKKTKTRTLEAPKTNLPEINIPISSSNISSTLKTQGSLRAPSNNLPAINLTPASIEPISLSIVRVQDKKITVNQTETNAPSYEIRKQEEIQVQLPIESSPIEKQIEEIPEVKSDVSTSITKVQQVKEIKNVSTDAKKSSSFEIKAPAINIPELDLSGPPKMDAYLSFNKQEELESVSESIQSRSDSGLEAIVSSHVHPSSPFGTVTMIADVQQLPSISSGLGSEILDKTTIKSSTLSDIQILQPTAELKEELKYDLAHKITMNDEIHSKLISRQDQLKACLESEISKVIIDYDPKADHKPLEKILTRGVDLIKDKKVTTYSELQHKLTVEHEHNAFIVDSVVRSLYCTIEKQGLDNLDKPEFPSAIRDMVRLPTKQTYDTVTHLNKEATPLATTQMTNETQSPISTVAAPNAAAITIETKLPEQKIKSTDDAARSCLTCGRSKSKPKVSSPSLTTATTTISSIGLLDERHRSQLNIHRHELVDPTVDIIRDTLNHCDITQMNEKINLDILNSNISQTANLYNNQSSLLTNDEHNALKSNQLSWLQQYLINNELKEKKLTRKQNRELSKILHRTLEILSTNHISTWDELTLQLQREYPKAHDLCHRAVELVKQSQKNGLLLLQQAPNTEEKRRSSFIITDRARQNLKINRNKIILSLKNLLNNHNKLSNDDNQLDMYLEKTFDYLEEQKQGQFKNYNDLKQQLKQDFKKNNQENLIEQIVDVIEQAHATNQFDDIDKPEVQALLQDRLNGKPLIIKAVYVSLPPRIGGALKSSNEDSSRYISTSANGDQTFNNTLSSHAVGRGLSWREANERARILFYRGKHPAIHYDEQAAVFDVRMLLETASGGTQEIPVTDSDVHELLNSCGVQWDGVNIISLVDHSEDVVRAAEQAALKVIREKGIIDLRAPPSTNSVDVHDDDADGSVASSPDASTPSS